MKLPTTSIVIFCFCLLFLTSCEVIEKPLKVEVTVSMPLASKTDTILPEPFLSLLKPVEFGDTLMYVPSVFYKRIDTSKPIAGQIQVPISAISEFQKSINTYTPNDYKSDVETAIDEEILKMEAALIAKSDKSDEELMINEADYDLIWVRDSALINAPNKFASTQAMKEYMAKELQKRSDKSVFKVLIMPKKSESIDPSLDSMKAALYKVLSGKNWQNAPQVAQMLVNRYGKSETLFQELLSKADKQFDIAKTTADSSKDCNFIALPLVYYSCAAILGEGKSTKTIISQREASCKSYAKSKGCTFTTITLPSSFVN